jgi:hypothetical protein
VRIPRVRFTVRRLMIVVVIVAGLLWGLKMRRLSVSYSEQAATHASEQKFWDSGVSLSNVEIARRTSHLAELREKANRDRAEGFPEVANNFERLIELESHMLNYYLEDARIRKSHRDESARLNRKYYRAARYPWLSVEPDPPEPE